MQANSSLVFSRLLRIALMACSLFVSIDAKAAPVTVSYSGNVSGHLYYNQSLLASFMPLDTAMTLSLTFNETFSDLTYDFSDNLGPVSGTMTVGGLSYVFNDYAPVSYAFDISTNDVNWVSILFMGSGPVPSGADLHGLVLTMTPDMTLFNNPLLSFSWFEQFDGYSVTSYGRVEFTEEGTVPEPASIALLGIGLFGMFASRQRRR